MADLIKPDLCVIGAGTLGRTLAIKARQRGLDVVLVRPAGAEPGDPADNSLRRAAFLASARRAQAVRTASQLGLDTAAPKPNLRSISERAAGIAQSIVPQQADDRLAALGITVMAGEASFVDRQVLRCGESRIRARHFALATGAHPLIPPLPGLDDVAYFTPDTIADNQRKLSHLLVIGGTPEAVELAQAHRLLGAMVTLVPQGGLLPGFDPELVALLLQVLREQGVAILDDATVTAIQPRSQGTGIALRRPAGEDSLDVSHILVALGRVPDLDGALLDKAGLRRDRLHPERLALGPDGQTSNVRVTALGGAAGEFAPHVGLRQASLLVERLLGQGRGRLDFHRLPRVVQTLPALAQVGLLEADRTLRPGQSVLRCNLAESQAARASGVVTGMAKLITDRKGTLLGAGAFGADAGEIMGLVALAMKSGLRLDALDQLALPQPSLAALLIEMAEQAPGLRPRASWRRHLSAIGRLLP